jgi:hypothetical protein
VKKRLKHKFAAQVLKHKRQIYASSDMKAQELITIWERIDSCDACRRQYQERSLNRRRGAPVSFNLSPERFLRDDHFDYETLADYVDKTLDGEMRQIADIHLRVCGRCREDLNSLVDFRRQIEPELNVRYDPGVRSNVAELIESWWRGLRGAWKPEYTAATMAVIGFAVTATIYFINAGPGKESTRGESSGHAPSPSVMASASPATKDSAKGTAQSPETTPTPNSGLAPDQHRPATRRPRANSTGKKNARPQKSSP